MFAEETVETVLLNNLITEDLVKTPAMTLYYTVFSLISAVRQ